MQINVTRSGSVLTLGLEGRLDALTSSELESALTNSLEGMDSLVLDFSKVDYVSSAGLRAILSAHKRMSGQGGMKVTNVNEGVMEILKMTGFADILLIE
ncbi:MAG: STAS domain-containing protein [Synergistaceae bacterium]|nr:STAS domain-containing protein [Synergistaceae bacterium]